MDIRQRSQVKQIFISPPFDNFIQGWTQDFPLSNYLGSGFSLYVGVINRTNFITTSDLKRFPNTFFLDILTRDIRVNAYYYLESEFELTKIAYLVRIGHATTFNLSDIASNPVKYSGVTSFEPNKLYKLTYLRTGATRDFSIREIPIVKTSFLRERRFFETYKSDTQTLKYALQMDKGYNVFNPLAGVGADRHIHNNDVDALANDIRNEIDVNSRERARLDRFNLEMNEGNLNIDIDGNYI